jgi:hypothetical protein
MNTDILEIDVDITACKVRNEVRFVGEKCTLCSANTVELSM